MLLPLLQEIYKRRVLLPGEDVRFLVRRDDMHVRPDKIGVRIHEVGTRGAIDKRDVDHFQIRDPLGGIERVEPLLRPLERLFPALEIEAILFQEEVPAIGDTADAEVKTLLEQKWPLLPDLAKKRAADVSDADHKERKLFPLLEERLMNDVDGPDALNGVDHEGNVALGRSLGDRIDVDIVLAERLEDLAGNSGNALHSVPDDRDDRLSLLMIQRCERMLELVPELVGDRPRCGRAVRGFDGETDRMFGRRLGDQDDVHLVR